MADISETRQEVLERLDRLIKFLARRVIDRNRLTAEMQSEIDQVKDRYAEELSAATSDIDETVTQIREIIEHHWAVVFTSKSVKLLYGVLASRKGGGNEKLDVARLLTLARKLGIVRKLFRVRVVQELDPMGLLLYRESRPEHQELIDGCFDITPTHESVTVKLNFDAPDLDTSHLSDKPIPVGKFPSPEEH